MDNNRRLLLKSLGIGACVLATPTLANEIIGEITKVNDKYKIHVYKASDVKITWNGIDLSDGFTEDTFLTIEPKENKVSSGEFTLTLTEQSNQTLSNIIHTLLM